MFVHGTTDASLFQVILIMWIVYTSVQFVSELGYKKTRNLYAL